MVFNYRPTPNSYCQQYKHKTEEFYISYNPSSYNTMIVIHDQFSWVLGGNHLDDFLSCTSFSECMKLLHERKEQLNSGSYALPPVGYSIDLITHCLKQVSCEAGLTSYSYKGWSVKRNGTQVSREGEVKVSPTPIQLADQLVAFIEGW